MNTKNYYKRGGFALSELLIVICIIGILAAFLLPTKVKAETGPAGFNITNSAFASSATYTCGNGVADLSEHDFTTLSYTLTVLGTAGTTNTIYFARTDSAGHVDAGPQLSWVVPVTAAMSAGGTSTYTFMTNYDRSTIGAASGLKLLSNVVVIASGSVTNPALNAELKTVKR